MEENEEHFHLSCRMKRKKKKTSADDKVELLMEQTGELEEKANLGGIDPPAPLRLYTPPYGQLSAAYYITRERKEEPGGKLCSGFS